MTCSHCGSDNAPGAPYCTRCGFPQTEAPPPASQWAPAGSTPPEPVDPGFEYVAYGSIEFVSPQQLPGSTEAIPLRPPTVIERLLGGNWLSAVMIAVPA